MVKTRDRHTLYSLSSFDMSRLLEPLAVGRVIGEVVDNFTPSVKMNITFKGNKQVCNGHELMPAVIVAKPRVEVGGQDMRDAFTLVRICPSYAPPFSLRMCPS